MLDTEVLRREQFKAVSELSKVQMALSEAQVALTTLQGKEAEYLKDREDKVFARVSEVIKTLESTFQEINKEITSMSHFRSGLESLADSLLHTSNSLEENSKEVNKILEGKMVSIEDKMSVIKAESLSMKIERSRLEGLLKEISIKKSSLVDQERLLKDRRDTLERAWTELKTKQKNADK